MLTTGIGVTRSTAPPRCNILPLHPTGLDHQILLSFAFFIFLLIHRCVIIAIVVVNLCRFCMAFQTMDPVASALPSVSLMMKKRENRRRHVGRLLNSAQPSTLQDVLTPK